MIKLTNKHNLPTSLVMWLKRDSYDYDSRRNAFSASTLIKNSKKTKLSSIVAKDPDEVVEIDVIEFVGRRRGTAIHDAIENAVDDSGVVSEYNIIQELRLEAELVVDGKPYIITGKFDSLENGIPQDWKTESTYSWGDEVKQLERIHQLSIYAWLCFKNGIPCSRTVGEYTQVFTDFSKAMRKLADDSDNPERYPPLPITVNRIELMDFDKLEEWMAGRIRSHTSSEDANQDFCSREDLWLGEQTFQYFTKPDAKRASKNFTGVTALYEANQHKANKGNKGVIKEKPQVVKACGYCLGRFRCNQYQVLKNQGLIDED